MNAPDRVFLTLAIIATVILTMMVLPPLPGQSHRRQARHVTAVNIVHSVSYPVTASTPDFFKSP